MTSQLADRLVAIEKVHGVDVQFLGQLLWFTISDMRITRDQLAQVFDEVGADKARLPKPISHRDAFRRATTQAEVKREPWTDGRYLNILVREVSMTPDMIVRQMVREVVDAKNRRLEYKPVASLTLQGEAFLVAPLVAQLGPAEQGVAGHARAAYDEERRNYNGRHVRDLVMDFIRGCSPVAVRPSGGVYFVPQKHEPTVATLASLVARLNAYTTANAGKSSLWSVPVVDAQAQRDMLEESLEEQVASESRSLIDEMAKLLKSGRKVTTHLVAQYADRARELGRKVKEYEDLLETESVKARANFDLALMQATALMDHVDTGASR